MQMRSWYKSSVGDFLRQDDTNIIGKLSQGSARDGFPVEQSQLDAWQSEIKVLKDQLDESIEATLFLEFVIPRMGKRIDAVLLIHSDKPHVVILEFKVGQAKFTTKDIDQVIDYSLELKNFHLGSHEADIFPVLIASEYSDAPQNNHGVGCLGGDQIRNYIATIQYTVGTGADGWEESPYKPTPTIIEAARAFYSGHNVEEITRNEAGDNITATCTTISNIIEHSKNNYKKQ